MLLNIGHPCPHQLLLLGGQAVEDLIRHCFRQQVGIDPLHLGPLSYCSQLLIPYPQALRVNLLDRLEFFHSHHTGLHGPAGLLHGHVQEVPHLAHGEEVRQPPRNGRRHAPLPEDLSQLVVFQLRTALLPGWLPLLHKSRVVSQIPAKSGPMDGHCGRLPKLGNHLQAMEHRWPNSCPKLRIVEIHVGRLSAYRLLGSSPMAGWPVAVSLHWWPRHDWSLWPCLRRALSRTVTRPLCRQCDNPTWSHTALLSRFHARCRFSFRLHNQHSWLLWGALWRACNLTAFTPCLTGPVNYPFASRHKGPWFNPLGGTYVKPGFSY